MSNELVKELANRFLSYVKIDTQSQENIKDRYPSTDKQKVLAKLLVCELKALGLEDAKMDQYGYVMATFPSNLPQEQSSQVPIIGLLAHMDTSPEVSGKDVKAIIHENYQGGDIYLPGDQTQVISIEDNPDLKDFVGDTLITSDGRTLLGADDKAGIAEILTMIDYLNQHSEIPHGTIRIGFTPDEEVGMGTKFFDVEGFGADYAYTVDGEGLGTIENETFNAAVAVFSIKGINVHPGYAKGKMVNALRIASDMLKEIEDEAAPETTEGREGYIHPYVLNGSVAAATLRILIRDFECEGMKRKSNRLKELQSRLVKKYPRAHIDLDIKSQYVNMRTILDKDSRILEYAMEAVKQTGIKARLRFIRGGTDGAQLSHKGLLTPNIFTGSKNAHSNLEWISLQAMEKAVQTLVNVVHIWAKKSLEILE